MAVNRIFVDRLNRLLTNIGMPKSFSERSMLFGRLFRLSHQTSYSIINGSILPRRDLLLKIASEFEVDQAWLLGSDRQVLPFCRQEEMQEEVG
jgi:hypothetical protein